MKNIILCMIFSMISSVASANITIGDKSTTVINQESIVDIHSQKTIVYLEGAEKELKESIEKILNEIAANGDLRTKQQVVELKDLTTN